jgi:hypothetical protein
VTAVQSAVPSATVANELPVLVAGAGGRAVLRILSVGQVARHFIHGNEMKEGMLNRVSAVVRAYDPCLSCSTHADGTPALEIALRGPGEKCWIGSAEGRGGDAAFPPRRLGPVSEWRPSARRRK